MSVFKIAKEELAEQEENEDLSQVDIMDHVEAHDDVADGMDSIQVHFDAILEADEIKDELEDKVASIEALAIDAITMYHVTDLKKTYIKACNRLNCEADDVSVESIDEGLKLSVEGIKEVIVKIIEAIKSVIAKIVIAIRKLWIKIQLAYGADEKVSKKLITSIELKVKKLNVDLSTELKRIFSPEANVSVTTHKSLLALFQLFNGNIYASDTIGDAVGGYGVWNFFNLYDVKRQNGTFLTPRLISLNDKLTVEKFAAITGYNINGNLHHGKPHKLSVVATKGATIYACLSYYENGSDEKDGFFYEYVVATIRTTGYVTNEKFSVTQQFTIGTITALGEHITTLCKHNIPKHYAELNKNINAMEKNLSDLEKHSNTKNSGDELVIKNNIATIKKFSQMIPRAYLDRMSAMLYLNKICIRLLSAIDRGLGE